MLDVLAVLRYQRRAEFVEVLAKLWFEFGSDQGFYGLL